MPQYFLLLPGDDERDASNEANLIGDANGFDVFWAGSALSVLMELVAQSPEMLPAVRIFKDTSKAPITIEQFLTEIKGLRVRSQWKLV